MFCSIEKILKGLPVNRFVFEGRVHLMWCEQHVSLSWLSYGWSSWQAFDLLSLKGISKPCN